MMNISDHRNEGEELKDLTLAKIYLMPKDIQFAKNWHKM